MTQPDTSMSGDRPLSVSLGVDKTSTHFLTHNCWNSMPEYFSRGSNETGVRTVVDGQVQDDFELIQHGWYDWQKAGEVINLLLTKGRAPRRIGEVMDYMKERRWVNQPPKARTM